MKVSARTLEKLLGVITGDGGPYPYRTGTKLVSFFSALGKPGDDGVPFTSRGAYTREKLGMLNDTRWMKDAILAAFNAMWDEQGVDCEQAAAEFNLSLSRDGFRLAKVMGPGWIENGRAVAGSAQFKLVAIEAGTIEPGALAGVSHDTLAEHVEKCRAKIASGDAAGAITNAYTLIEAVLKDLLRRTGTAFKEEEGDIRALYALLKGPLNLDPKTESLEAHLKTVLDGFQKIVAGLYATANKASDRHDRRHDPAPHHAKLVVNAAFTLGDFLYDTHDWQRARRAVETA